MKKNIRVIAAIVVIALVIIIPKLLSLNKNASAELSAGSDAQSVNIDVNIIKPQKLDETIRTTGNILPNEEITLQSETAGKVTGIYFKEGSFTKKGQLLIKINDAELQAKLKSAEFQKVLAEENEQRQRKQLDIQAVSREAYDQTLNNLNIFKSEIDLIMAQISKTEIRSPFAGRIGLKFVSEGSYINSSTRIATLVDNNPLKIEFSIPGKYAGRVHPGDSVNFYVQGIEKKLNALIYAIEPKIDPATRTLTMRALYNNSEQELLSGSFANIELIVSSNENALLIPTEALIPELNGSIVFLYKNGMAQPVAVKTGLRTSQSIEIKEGLSPGDTLITSGLLELRPGIAVKISEIN